MNSLLGFASLLGGLGLVLTGVRNLSATMLQVGGRPLRKAIVRHGGNPILIRAAGTAAGALLQSTNGVTFILASMVTVGLLPMATAMPLLIWANLGTSLLVVVAAVDLRVVTLLALGIAGIWSFIDREVGTGRRQMLEAVMAIAMLFLGLDLLRTGAEGMRGGGAAADALALIGASDTAAFALGFAATLFTQSSATTTIIAATSSQAGLLPFGGAAMVVLGASLGSGASVVLMGASARGSQRQLVLFQGLSKLLGVLVLIPLLVLERLTGWPLLLHAIAAMADDPGRQLAGIYIACQVAALAAYYVLSRPIGKLLAAMAPPLPAESLATPQFIYDAAVGDADIALILAEKEQLRLLSQLAPTLEQPDQAAAASIERLSREIDRFLGGVAGSGEEQGTPRRDRLDRLVNLRARNETLRLLHDTVFQLGQTRNGMSPGETAELADALSQGLGALLLCAEDAARDGGDENVDLLKRISSDRGNVIDAIRRRLVKATNQEAVYRMTSLFERAVWLVQRYAVLLGSAAPA